MDKRIALFDAEWKAVDGGDAGELEGYISAFGNVDLGGDIVMPGALRKTFADWNRARTPMPLIADHELSTSGVIGSVYHMEEDGYGAKVRARFASSQKAQDIRRLMVEGHLSGMSMTWIPVRMKSSTRAGQPVRELHEIKVLEATVTPVPMNQMTYAAAKAVSDKPWGNFTQADYTPEQWRSACVIDRGTGDVNSKARYALPVKEPNGDLSRGGVHAAAARINQVQGISAAVKATAARSLIRYYGQLGETPPDSLKNLASSSSISEELLTHLRTAVALPDVAAKAAVGALLDELIPPTIVADEPDGDVTTDVADDTGEPPAAVTTDASQFALDVAQLALDAAQPSGPRDDAPDGDTAGYPHRILEAAHVQADQDALEAEIREALGGLRDD